MGRTFKALLRPLAGAFSGLAVYWLFVVAKQVGHFVSWRYYDWERVRSECILPFVSPALLIPHTWRNFPLWVNLETLFSIVLVAAGVLLFSLQVQPNRR